MRPNSSPTIAPEIGSGTPSIATLPSNVSEMCSRRPSWASAAASSAPSGSITSSHRRHAATNSPKVKVVA